MSEPTADVAEVEDVADTIGTPEVADAGAAVDGGDPAGVEESDDVDVPQLDPQQLVGAVEAILFVLDGAVTETAIAAALQVPQAQVHEAIATLRAGYEERGAGIELRELADGLRLVTRSEFAPQVERFLQDGQRARLSQAALETLAVIAYRQPVTRQRVSAIRGVNVDGVVRTLLARGLILEVGADPESGASLFRTSELFLDRMGLNTLDELPSLAPLLPDLALLEQEEL